MKTYKMKHTEQQQTSTPNAMLQASKEDLETALSALKASGAPMMGIGITQVGETDTECGCCSEEQEYLSKQEVYDTVRRHLLSQEAKAQETTGFSTLTSCRYRVGELKCAVGCLINDEEYDENMEEMRPWYKPDAPEGSGGYWQHQVLVASGMKPTVDNAEFLRDLQNIHDSENITSWEKQLDQFAQDHGLEINDE